MATPVCTVDATGIHLPPFTDVLSYLQDAYRGIYGSDVYLAPDSQDGQFLGILAAAVNDANAMAVAVYNAFSPSTAQGTGLSSVVKINGIARTVATYSMVDVLIVGQAGATITNGLAADTSSNQWALPASVVVPTEGQITVTATAVDIGAISAPSGTVTSIVTPTQGWQSVTNPSAAVPGSPVETDAALRARQTLSTALPSHTVMEGIIGAVASISGVTAFRGYENDTNVTDGNGIPGHSISLVVRGGDAQAIANAIAEKKTPGAGTYGTTTETVTDAYGIPHLIGFYRPTPVPIFYAITIKALSGFTTDIQAQIVQAISDWTNSVGIGNPVRLTRAYVPANLGGSAASATFEVTALTVGTSSGALSSSDVNIAFDEMATCVPAQIAVTVTS
jgi:uncharacterized phage protein gp47/JayE